MNGLVTKNSVFVLPESKVKTIREFAKKKLKETPFPTTQNESFRKFPLASLDLKSLGVDDSGNAGYAAENGEEFPISNTEWEIILNSFIQNAPNQYFSYLTLTLAQSYRLTVFSESGEVLNSAELAREGSDFFVNIIYIKPNLKVKLIEDWNTGNNSEDENLRVLGSVGFYFVSENTQVSVLHKQNFDENLYHFSNFFSASEKNSTFNFHFYPLGGFRSKEFFTAHLLGENSSVFVDGVSALGARELKDLEMEIRHLAHYTTSKISYKTIVTDKAHHLFTGNLIIPPNLKKVNAHQESFNLSLNKKARAEANPKLEVLAEDVSCTHGATVGEINEEQYFYLLCRGLTPGEAKSLLVTAFYGETIHSMDFSDSEKSDLESKIKTIVIGGKNNGV
ncbi:SufD family Fe-S cluster assembly protein [Leptospira sp. 96542]|nr:SufD family Fe-S cluster assembly protein [Leptospira sp. 96542]